MVNLDLNKVKNSTLETIFSKYPETKEFEVTKKNIELLNFIEKYIEVYCSTMLQEYLELLLKDVPSSTSIPYQEAE